MQQDRKGGFAAHNRVVLGIVMRNSNGVQLSATASGGDDPVKLIIAGAPASGKGTQCEVIKEKFGVVHLSTGDMLRAAVAAETAVGKQAKDYMDSGKLVPDDVIIGVVSSGILDPRGRRSATGNLLLILTLILRLSTGEGSLGGE